MVMWGGFNLPFCRGSGLFKGLETAHFIRLGLGLSGQRACLKYTILPLVLIVT